MRKLKFYICKVLIFLLNKLYPMEYYSDSESKSLKEFIHNNVLQNLPNETFVKQTIVIDSQLSKITFNSIFIHNNIEYDLIYSIEYLIDNKSLKIMIEKTPCLTLDTLINLLNFIKDNYNIHYNSIKPYFEKMILDKIKNDVM